MLKITFHNSSKTLFYEPNTGITIQNGDTTVPRINDNKLSDIKEKIKIMNESNGSDVVSLDYESIETPNTITPNQKGLILDVGDSISVSVSLSSDLKEEDTNWSVSNSSILRLSSNGNTATITALTDSEACSVIVKNGTSKAFFNVKIHPTLTGITITPESKNIGLGTSYQLSIEPIPTNARILNPTWSSSNPNIASVDSGLVKAQSLGICDITVSYKNVSKSSKIEITDKYIATFTPNEKSISVGESYQSVLNVTKNDSATKDIKPNYITSNSSIATVDANGVITGVSSGKAIISAYEDTKYSTSLNINVSVVSITGISLSPTNLNLYATNEQTLETTITPTNATNKNLTYRSDNTAVATVNSLGKIVAKSVGTANITGTANDGSEISSSMVVNVLETLVSSISLNNSTQTLVIGATSQLTATIQPSTATNKTISWSTTNSNSVVVDNSGLVTAVGTGNATIVATSNDDNRKSAICIITVNQKT